MLKTKFLDAYTYQVEVNSDGKKVIHIDGYCYNGEGNGYQLVQGTWCYMDVDGTQCGAKADELFQETKQYQGDVTSDKVDEYYADCVPLPFDKVTQGTPAGRYVDACDEVEDEVHTTVYTILYDWINDDNGIELFVFDTWEKAKAKYDKIKKEIKGIGEYDTKKEYVYSQHNIECRSYVAYNLGDYCEEHYAVTLEPRQVL